MQEIERVLGDAAERSEAARPEQPSVLVVDDDVVERRLACTLLEQSGFHVREASDGTAALTRFAGGEEYSLIVLDLNMPHLDGREVLARLRQSIATAGTPVIVLTGSDDVETEVQLMDAGADDYIRKPIDPPQFLARVNATLRRAAA